MHILTSDDRAAARTAFEGLTALALDRTRPAAARMAAVEALDEVPGSSSKTLREQLRNDPAQRPAGRTRASGRQGEAHRPIAGGDAGPAAGRSRCRARGAARGRSINAPLDAGPSRGRLADERRILAASRERGVGAPPAAPSTRRSARETAAWPSTICARPSPTRRNRCPSASWPPSRSSGISPVSRAVARAWSNTAPRPTRVARPSRVGVPGDHEEGAAHTPERRAETDARALAAIIGAGGCGGQHAFANQARRRPAART